MAEIMYTKLQYISQGLTCEEQLENIQGVLEAGCSWVQLRFKNGEHKELYDLAEKVKMLCSTFHATFIMNDHVDIAKTVDADGVHLGLLDMPVEKARSILGEDKIIGGTANTTQDVTIRINEKCDYIGLGPYRFTSTKEKLSPVLGLEGIALIMDKVSQEKFQGSSVSKFQSETLKPCNILVYAIGGITLNDVSALMKTGVFGVAVSGEITNHSNSSKKELIEKFNLLLYEEFDHCR